LNLLLDGVWKRKNIGRSMTPGVVEKTRRAEGAPRGGNPRTGRRAPAASLQPRDRVAWGPQLHTELLEDAVLHNWMGTGGTGRQRAC